LKQRDVLAVSKLFGV